MAADTTHLSENDEIGQLNLGQSLLSEAEVEGNDEAKSFEAVKWLVKSSRSGNEKATELLKRCLENGIGINDTNIQDVQWCIKTSSWEKRSRAAASKLFRKICLEDRNLTLKEYKERVLKLSNNSREEKLLQRAIKNGISEEAFVDRVIYQLQGKSKWSLKSLMRIEESGDESKLNSLKKILLNPTETIIWIADNIIETAGSQGMNWLRTLIPVQQVYFLVVLFAYSLISKDAMLWIFPIIGFYISLISISICTMQMFYAKRKLGDVRALADVLDRFGETFIQESAESAYSWSSLTPYISFFFSLPLLIITFVTADKAWIPCAEICCLAFVITVASWFALSDSYDHLAALAILLDNISTLPDILEKFPQIPGIYHVLHFIGSPGLSVEITSAFVVNVGIPSLAYLIIPMIFIGMAMRKSWRGTYQIMVPHIVCFLWWRIVVMFYMETSWYGLVKASLGWTLIVVLSPFILVIGLLWLTFQILKIFTVSGFKKITTTVCLLGSVALYTYWSRGGFKFGQFSLEKKTYKSNLILTLVLLASFVPLVYIATPEAEDTGKITHYLPWDVFNKHCGNIAKSMDLTAAINCQHFLQVKVNWNGEVQHIAIKKVENPAENFVQLLPTLLSGWLKCTYGIDYDSVNDSLEMFNDIQKFNKLQDRSCHLKNFNRYTFEIKILIDGRNVALLAPDIFFESLARLKQGDTVNFKGYLSENLVIPTINIYSLKCLSCMETIRTASQLDEHHFMHTLRDGICKIFNFFLCTYLRFQVDV